METFKYVIYLFACASRGEKVEIIKDIDIKEIYNISIKHGIWSIVFLAIKELYEKDRTVFDLNDKIFYKLDSSFMKSVTRNIIKWQRLPDILKEIENCGIDVCLLKGLTIGVLYKEPYSRTTTDIDLLVSPEYEEKVCEIFRAQGFNIMYRWEDSHHTKCTRDDIGLVEIHTQLYDKIVQELWFDVNVIQNYDYDDFGYENLVCKQLNATDGLIFNFLHFVKHYISGLITVKQLMDVMLYIKRYISSIDFVRFESVITSLNYFDLFMSFKCLAVKYFGFSLEDFHENSTLYNYSERAEMILQDMNKYVATENASVYHIYTKTMLEKKKAFFAKRNIKNKIKTIYSLIWMDKKRMNELYGDVYEKKHLKLFLQMHRIFLRVINIKKYIIKKSAAEEKELYTARERISLFKKLGIL